MRVLFLTQYDQNGPSSRIRVYQFIPFLEKLGINCEIKPLLSGSVKELVAELFSAENIFRKALASSQIFWAFIKRYGHVFQARNYDVVVVQKDVLPFGLLWILKFFNPKIIYEFDDAIWEPTPGEKKKTLLMKLVFAYRSSLLKRILKQSAAVLAENSYLAKYAKKFNDDVSIIAAPIDTQKYIPSKRAKSDDVTIGWVGSPGTTYLLESIQEPLKKILDQHKNIKLMNLGGSPIISNGLKIENVKWSEDSEVSDLQKFDIGLMPLDDTLFNRGRLGYKIILYFSVGIPTVASKIGLNCEVMTDGLNGFLVKSENDWIEALEKLIEDPQLCEKMGKKSRQIAEEQYDVRICADRYADLLLRVANEKV